VGKFGEARFSDFVPNVQPRDFTVSNNADEWKFVDRLIPLELIPSIPKKDRYPSGFQPPHISPEDAIEKYGYFVGRPSSQMLPVYLLHESQEVSTPFLLTKIRKAEGNLFKLREDIDAFLKDRYKREFVCQVSELQQHVCYKADLEEELKEFLLKKGF
jgi:large subunit ribosomal protein L49